MRLKSVDGEQACYSRLIMSDSKHRTPCTWHVESNHSVRLGFTSVSQEHDIADTTIAFFKEKTYRIEQIGHLARDASLFSNAKCPRQPAELTWVFLTGDSLYYILYAPSWPGWISSYFV